MKKLFTIALTLAFFTKLNAQTEKVGINKDNPAYTLDIEGSMRIKELGVSDEHSKLLAWDPATQQVVFSPDKSIKKPFYNLVYTITLGYEPHEDWSRSTNIGIDESKYKVVLTQATLVSKDFSYTNPNAGKLMITAMTQTEAGDTPHQAGVLHGKIMLQGGNNDYDISNDQEANERYLGYPIATTMIMDEATTRVIQPRDTRITGMYRFLADYEFARPVYLKSEKPELLNKWIISLLIMDKTLVTELGTSEIQ